LPISVGQTVNFSALHDEALSTAGRCCNYEIYFRRLKYKIKLLTRSADVAKWQTQRT
jgi:hypothetical protein